MQKKKYEYGYIGRNLEAIIENIEITKKENKDNKIDAVIKEAIAACKVLDDEVLTGGKYPEDLKLNKYVLDYSLELITIVKVYKISEKLLIESNNNQKNIEKYKKKIYELIMDDVYNIGCLIE